MPARAGLDRDSVVHAAAELIDEKGQPDVTLAELAARLGVRAPSLYNHIDGQEDLQRALALYGTRELGRRIGRAAIGKSGSTALVAIGAAYRQFAKDRPGLYQATLQAPAADEPDRTSASDEILDVLRLVLEPLGLPAELQIHAMRSVRSLMHGFVSLELTGGFGLPIDINESFDYLLSMMVAGLTREPGSV